MPKLNMSMKNHSLFCVLFCFICVSLAPSPLLAQVDRIELGWQTSSRGIVWYSSSTPTHEPAWKFARDTNKVLWVDTSTALRYDWDYLNNVWRTKGTATGAVPPLPQEISGSAVIDNRTAFWIRDTFDLLHKYDSTANAWTPMGDWFFLSDVPSDIAATGSNGAAKYRRSLWQDADDNKLYYFDGSAWVEIGGDLSITNEIQTISASGAGPTSYDIGLDLGGGSVTLAEGSNIDLTRSGNTITITSTASGGGSGLTEAENGLTVVNDTMVRLGGTLIVPTLINQSTHEMRWWGTGKWSVSNHTGYGMTPSNAKAGFTGAEAAPTNNSSPTINGTLEMQVNSSGTEQSNTLAFGGWVTDADGYWIQSRSRSNPGFEYPLALQPNRGQLSVGRRHDLNDPDAFVTISGLGLTGTTASGSVLHLEHSEGHGNVPLSFGAGTDIVDAEVMWRDADDAFRVTNRNNINNSSSIRFAIGGQTNDLATLVKSSNTTSKAKFAVGEGNPANVHSTIQANGSIAAATVQTSSSLTVNEQHYFIYHILNSTVTYTLPDPSTCPGRMYTIHHFGTSGQIGLNYNVIASSGTTFNAVPATMWAWIISDGTNWQGYRLTSS